MKKSKRLRNLWHNLSPQQRFTVRRLYYLPSDLYEQFINKRHRYVPPKGYIYTGSPSNSKEYILQGLHQLELLKEDIDIKPDDSVLDIGSGIGRTAIALTTYLNEKGFYEGFDVVEKGVQWCNKKIKKDHSNFNFKYIPLFNDLYNENELEASEFKFPYPDNHFDKIFSFSVFTHMKIDEIQHYFSEIKRVLKPDGKAFSTFFVYDDNTEKQIANNEKFSFPYLYDGYRLMSNVVQSGNIAIHKEKLNEMLQNSNLELVSLTEGFWKNKENSLNEKEYQDIVVFK